MLRCISCLLCHEISFLATPFVGVIVIPILLSQSKIPSNTHQASRSKQVKIPLTRILLYFYAVFRALVFWKLLLTVVVHLFFNRRIWICMRPCSSHTVAMEGVSGFLFTNSTQRGELKNLKKSEKKTLKNLFNFQLNAKGVGIPERRCFLTRKDRENN